MKSEKIFNLATASQIVKATAMLKIFQKKEGSERFTLSSPRSAETLSPLQIMVL